MDVRTFLREHRKNPADIERVAREAQTTVAYLHQLAGGHRLPSAKLTLALERSSGRRMTRYELRPDLYPTDDTAETTVERVG